MGLKANVKPTTVWKIEAIKNKDAHSQITNKETSFFIRTRRKVEVRNMHITMSRNLI